MVNNITNIKNSQFNLKSEQIFNYYSYNNPNKIFEEEQPTLSERFSPKYGSLFAKEILKVIKEKNIKYIIEIGAGRGQLAYDIITFINKKAPEIFKNIRYIIVELSQKLAQLQKTRLADFNVAVIVGNALSLPLKQFNKQVLVISNEMIADLPYVYTKNKQETSEYYNKFGIRNFDYKTSGYINLGVLLFIKELGRIINKGIIYIIEYGRKNKSVLNKLGGSEKYHYECGINWNLVKLFTKQFLKIEQEGILSELFHINSNIPILWKAMFSLINIIPHRINLEFYKWIRKVWMRRMKQTKNLDSINIIIDNLFPPFYKYKNRYNAIKFYKYNSIFKKIERVCGKTIIKYLKKIFFKLLTYKDTFLFISQISRKMSKNNEVFYFLKLSR